ncbi:hypothetical protein A8D96_15735 [Burkholderia cenocepacia]|nr:hypothetical protein A8D96_15735 [Burkholderia cenocepacia]
MQPASSVMRTTGSLISVSLKFLVGLPLTFRRHTPYGCGVRRITRIADIHCFIHAPQNPFY